MDEHKRLIKNTGIIALGNLSTKMVSFLLLPLYTSLLSTEDYGNFDYLISIATFLVPFVSVLMDESIFRFLIDCKTDRDTQSVISTTFVIVFLGMLLFILVGTPLMHSVGYQYSYFAVAYVLVSVVCGMLSAFLRGIGRMDQYALFNFLTGTIQVALNVVFIGFLRMGLLGMVYAALITQLTVSIIFTIKSKLWSYINLKAVNAPLAKEMVVYALPLIPNRISWNIINMSDRIIMMNTLGSGATGIYAIAHKFPSLMDMVYGFFYQSWKESSARILGDSSQDTYYNSVYNYLKNFMYSVVIGMTAFMPLIFKLLINETYHEALFYVPILTLAVYFSNISGFYGGIFTAYKDTKIMGITTVVSAVINLVAHLLLVSYIGMYAAAVSTLVANLVVYLYRKKKVRKYVVLVENRFHSAAAVIITGIILFLYYSENAIFIVGSWALATVYALVMNRKLILPILNKWKGIQQ